MRKSSQAQTLSEISLNVNVCLLSKEAMARAGKAHPVPLECLKDGKNVEKGRSGREIGGASEANQSTQLSLPCS